MNSTACVALYASGERKISLTSLWRLSRSLTGEWSSNDWLACSLQVGLCRSDNSITYNKYTVRLQLFQQVNKSCRHEALSRISNVQSFFEPTSKDTFLKTIYCNCSHDWSMGLMSIVWMNKAKKYWAPNYDIWHDFESLGT